MLKKISGIFKRIPRNIPEDPGECSKRFRGMFEEIPENVQKDSGNAEEDSEEC